MRNELLQVGLPPKVMDFYKKLAQQRYQKVATVVRDVLVEHYREINDEEQPQAQEDANGE